MEEKTEKLTKAVDEECKNIVKFFDITMFVKSSSVKEAKKRQATEEYKEKLADLSTMKSCYTTANEDLSSAATKFNLVSAERFVIKEVVMIKKPEGGDDNPNPYSP